MKSPILFGILAVLSFPVLGADRVQFELSEKAAAVLVPILAEAEGWNEVQQQGYRPGEAIAAARCEARVLRPGAGDAPTVSSSENEIRCELSYADGARGSVVLSLASAPISPWGSRSDRKPFNIEGELAGKLFEAIKQASLSHPSHPLMDSMEFDGPGGEHISSYGIKSGEDIQQPNAPSLPHPLAVGCNEYRLNGKVWKTFCSFLYFER